MLTTKKKKNDLHLHDFCYPGEIEQFEIFS